MSYSFKVTAPSEEYAEEIIAALTKNCAEAKIDRQATRKQVHEIRRQCSLVDVTNRDERLALVASLRPLASTIDLFLSEASLVIEKMKGAQK